VRTESVSLRDLILQGPDDHAVGCIAKALEAGSRGDAVASLTHDLEGGFIVQSPHRFIMQDFITQGSAAPAWAWSRWCLDLAYRTMLMRNDPCADEGVRHVMALLHLETMERLLEDETELRIFGTRLAAGDHLVADLALFEFGGLQTYLDQVAQPGLLARTDRIREWAMTPTGAYELLDHRGCRLVLRDLLDDTEVHALNIGATCGGSDGAFVGRLVPISVEPGLMFAQRPLTVEVPVALRVAEGIRSGEPLGWLWALSSAAHEAGLEEGFHRTPPTPYTSDLPMPEIVVGDTAKESQAGRLVEWRAKGHSALVANALGVLHVGLIAAGISDGAAAVVSPHVASALSTPGAPEAAAEECCGPGTAGPWRILAGVVPEHLAARAEALADRAEALAGQAEPDAHS
jgi:hypothetical protein